MDASSRILLSTLLLTVATGCSEISLHTVDTQERVISRTRQVVPGSGVRVHARVDGTQLHLVTRRGCELVSWERVERVRRLEADEDLTEELVFLGVGAIPLAVGIGVLADAHKVHDNDRNARRYNSLGTEGAYIVGGVVTGIGGAIDLAMLVQLARIGAAGEERTEVSERRGPVLSDDVACREEGAAIRTSVVLEAAGRRLATPGTDRDGRLDLDLAEVVPPALAERATSVRVIVGDRVVGELATEPILDRQRQLRRLRADAAWKGAEVERCRRAPKEDAAACQGVEAYLRVFGDGGAHAAEAAALLEGRSRAEVTIAAEPEDPTAAPSAASDPATTRAIEEGRIACVQACRSRCATPACSDACQEACR